MNILIEISVQIDPVITLFDMKELFFIGLVGLVTIMCIIPFMNNLKYDLFIKFKNGLNNE